MTQEQIKQIVKFWLAQLEGELGKFDQTTHGLIISEPTLETAFAYIVKMYNNPTAYNVSNASQAIHAFLIQNK